MITQKMTEAMKALQAAAQAKDVEAMTQQGVALLCYGLTALGGIADAQMAQLEIASRAEKLRETDAG